MTVIGHLKRKVGDANGISVGFHQTPPHCKKCAFLEQLKTWNYCWSKNIWFKGSKFVSCSYQDIRKPTKEELKFRTHKNRVPRNKYGQGKNK